MFLPTSLGLKRRNTKDMTHLGPKLPMELHRKYNDSYILNLEIDAFYGNHRERC